MSGTRNTKERLIFEQRMTKRIEVSLLKTVGTIKRRLVRKNKFDIHHESIETINNYENLIKNKTQELMSVIDDLVPYAEQVAVPPKKKRLDYARTQ